MPGNTEHEKRTKQMSEAGLVGIIALDTLAPHLLNIFIISIIGVLIGLIFCYFYEKYFTKKSESLPK